MYKVVIIITTLFHPPSSFPQISCRHAALEAGRDVGQRQLARRSPAAYIHQLFDVTH